MSHQSLKDLVDVTGTPSDGQVLKYTASSTSWEPADESGGGGGGSSDTPYFEMWDFGSADTNAQTKMAMPLHVPTSAKILNNTIASNRLALVTDSHWTTCTFDSSFDNSYHFQRSTTYQYYIEVDYTVKLDNSADIADSIVVRLNDTGDNNSGSGGYNKSGYLAGTGVGAQKVVNFVASNKFTVSTHNYPSLNPHYGYGGGNSAPGTTESSPYEAYDAGTYLNFRAGWLFTPTTSNSNTSQAVTPSFISLTNSASAWGNSSSGALHFNHSNATIYNPLTVMHRKVRVVQLA